MIGAFFAVGAVLAAATTTTTAAAAAAAVGPGRRGLPLHQPHQPAQHPRLFYTADMLPGIRSNAAHPYMAGVLRQYEAALLHKLNYSAGGQMMDLSHLADARMGLATAIYVANHSDNATEWGIYAKAEVRSP